MNQFIILINNRKLMKVKKIWIWIIDVFDCQLSVNLSPDFCVSILSLKNLWYSMNSFQWNFSNWKRWCLIWLGQGKVMMSLCWHRICQWNNLSMKCFYHWNHNKASKFFWQRNFFQSINISWHQRTIDIHYFVLFILKLTQF